MQHLIPITDAAIGKITLPTVRSIDLHAVLQNERSHIDWLSAVIEQYADDGIDYYVQDTSVFIGFHLTLGIAQQLAFAEPSELGHRVYHYLVEAAHRRFFLADMPDVLDLTRTIQAEVNPAMQLMFLSLLHNTCKQRGLKLPPLYEFVGLRPRDPRSIWTNIARG